MHHKSAYDHLVKRPIIIIGAHRSGTTWLLRGLRQTPELACLGEPRVIWVYRNWFKPDDVLTAKDARPAVVRYIRRRFAVEVRGAGKERLCEKTPSNALRIPFVKAVFPDARIVLIVRDGRSVFRSTEQIKNAAPIEYARSLGQKLRATRVVEMPAYLSRLSVGVRKLLGRAPAFWGAKPPGWREWVGQETPDRVVAKQWAGIMECSLRDLAALDDESYRIIRYEDVIRSTREVMSPLMEFLEVKAPEDVVSFFESSARQDRIESWRNELPTATLEEIRPIMEPIMNQMGYQW